MKNKTSLGIIFGLLSIIFYALINLISQETSNFFTFKHTLIFASIFVAVKELTAILSFFFIKLNPIERFKSLIKAFSIYKKELMWAGVAGFFGGALGFVLVTAGGIFIGSALSSPFFTLEIIIVIMVSKFAFKRSVTKWHIMGISIIAISLILLATLNIIESGTSFTKESWVGLTLILLGIISWSIEAIIFDYITRDKNIKINNLILSKQLFSVIILFIILIPIFSLIDSHTFGEGYKEFGTLFTINWKSLLFMLLAGILLYLGRYFFFSAVKWQGATIANTLYNLLGIVQIPVAFIFKAIDPSINFIGNIHWISFIPLNITIIIGVLFTLKGQLVNKQERL